jgi:hypothetical protein
VAESGEVVMPTTRDELISDWREQLAAAQECAGTSPRSAWLSRMRVRLYRFLLACYGNATWEPPPRSADNSALVFDSAEARSLDGKPAKSLGQIRSVLTAVAKAQDESHAPGPLAGGLDVDSWVVVAAGSSKLKVDRCVELLAKTGLHPRLCQRGDDQTVEVPAHERHEAFDIVEQYRERLHAPPNTLRSQPIPGWGRFAALGVIAIWVSGSLAWVIAACAWGSTGVTDNPANGIQPTDFVADEAFLGIWASTCLVALLILGLAFFHRQRPGRSVKKRVC